LGVEKFEARKMLENAADASAAKNAMK